MADATQAKRQAQNLLETLLQLQSENAQHRMQAQQELQRCEREDAILAAAIAGIRPIRNLIEPAAEAAPGHNRKVISDILKERGQPMKLAEIAKVAFESQRIRSRRGYKGVYATVSTNLARNKRLFVHDNGMWSLMGLSHMLKTAAETKPIEAKPTNEDPILRRLRVLNAGKL